MGEAAIGEVQTKSDCVVLVVLHVGCELIEELWCEFDNGNMHEVYFLIMKSVGYVLFDYSHITS